MSGNLADFTYAGPTTELKVTDDPVRRNLGSSISILTLLVVLTWFALIVPVVVMVWKAALW